MSIYMHCLLKFIKTSGMLIIIMIGIPLSHGITACTAELSIVYENMGW